MKEKKLKRKRLDGAGPRQNLIKASPDLRLVLFRNRGIDLAVGNRGPGLYLRKYGISLICSNADQLICSNVSDLIRSTILQLNPYDLRSPHHRLNQQH